MVDILDKSPVFVTGFRPTQQEPKYTQSLDSKGILRWLNRLYDDAIEPCFQNHLTSYCKELEKALVDDRNSGREHIVKYCYVRPSWVEAVMMFKKSVTPEVKGLELRYTFS